ncbi:GtrA family protein [Erwinia amylovora]|uniref:GtrA family protein n=1 Tax=Erwinia amylovora TaxID=552 RepID=UPI000C074902|nr:GtrA family protein [Erwinia amylovora]
MLMIKLFLSYSLVGIVNTLIHWVIFSALYLNGCHQWVSNLSAFCVAVTFSFFANAKWTFNSEATTVRYTLYVLFMGTMAAAVGWYADYLSMNPIITLVAFSFVSLLCGFIYSKLIIFSKKK